MTPTEAHRRIIQRTLLYPEISPEARTRNLAILEELREPLELISQTWDRSQKRYV